MAEKNRQHYVPQFYLRNYSLSKKSIATYHIIQSKYIEGASIKDMCKKHNFYGSDKKVENFLNEEIETKASSIISKILETNRFPDDDDYVHLAMFLLISEARNLRTAESANNMFDFMAKALLKEDPGFKDLGLDLDSFKVEMNQPANHNILAAMESTPLILDLKPILIVEQTGARQFITSDNPLIRYNSLYLSKRYRGGFGIIDRGMQLFFPISSHKCILLYDSLAYDIPEEKNGILTLNKARDVDHLNELFYLNAYNNVFFNQKIKRDYIEGIHYKNKRTPKIKDLKREVASFKDIDSNGELIAFSSNRVSKKINFSWIKPTQYANNLKMPDHMGGIKRTESPFIREVLEREKAEFAKNPPPFKERHFISEVKW